MFYFAPGMGAEYIAMSTAVSVVCLSVCLSLCSQSSKTTRPNIWARSMLPVAVAGFCSGGVAIRYLFPVFWMTPCFYTIDSMVVMCIPTRPERNSRNYYIDSNQILLGDKEKVDVVC